MCSYVKGVFTGFLDTVVVVTTYHATPAANAWHGYVDNVLAKLLSPLGRAVGLVGTGPFNLGRPEDYRVPDRGSHRRLPGEVWVATCAIVVEVLSPNAETWEKFDFYFLRDVDEICIADPERAELRWFARDALAHGYRPTESSDLLGVTVAQLPDRLASVTSRLRQGR